MLIADIDECAEDPTICGSLNCENFPGSYNCYCYEGYQVKSGATECEGIGLLL